MPATRATAICRAARRPHFSEQVEVVPYVRQERPRCRRMARPAPIAEVTNVEWAWCDHEGGVFLPWAGYALSLPLWPGISRDHPWNPRERRLIQASIRLKVVLQILLRRFEDGGREGLRYPADGGEARQLAFVDTKVQWLGHYRTHIQLVWHPHAFRYQGRLAIRFKFPPDPKLSHIDRRLSARRGFEGDPAECLSFNLDFSWVFSSFSSAAPMTNPRVLRPISAPFARNVFENDLFPLAYPDELENLPP